MKILHTNTPKFVVDEKEETQTIESRSSARIPGFSILQKWVGAANKELESLPSRNIKGRIFKPKYMR